MNKKIICGSCGHTEERLDVEEAIVYFPAGMIYLKDAGKPFACPVCRKDGDMVLFGEQFISALRFTE